MDALPPLPSLGSIALGTAGDSDAARNVVPAAVSTALGVNPFNNKLPSLQSIIVIIVGLMLIAAGIFSFREVRQTVIETSKTAAKAAAA